MNKTELLQKLSDIHALLTQSMTLRASRDPGYVCLVAAENKLNNLLTEIAREPDSNPATADEASA